MKAGSAYPHRLIAMGPNSPEPGYPKVLMVEGYKRITAFAMVDAQKEIGAFFASGALSVAQKWRGFPPRRSP
jgi:hypothetical protein